MNGFITESICCFACLFIIVKANNLVLEQHVIFLVGVFITVYKKNSYCVSCGSRLSCGLIEYGLDRLIFVN